MQQLRIFTYHNIGTPPAGALLPRLYVEAGQFDRQCRLLSRLGIRGVSMGEGLQALRAGEANKTVVLSFDDGYTDNLTNAAPILQRYGFHATCYVVSGAIGGHNAWDSEMLAVEKPVMDAAAMAQWLDAGHEIGSHTVTHPQLSQLDRARAAYEISESRRQLQRVTGTAVEHFCYPFGDHDEQSVELVREAGYLSAVTTRRGPALTSSDPLLLPRISVNRGRGLFKFGLHAATPYSWLRRH
jgi:peptidoglycan/xylan/chitin deacetylase (PgdA/CDA1 family)